MHREKRENGAQTNNMKYTEAGGLESKLKQSILNLFFIFSFDSSWAVRLRSILFIPFAILLA